MALTLSPASPRFLSALFWNYDGLFSLLRPMKKTLFRIYAILMNTGIPFTMWIDLAIEGGHLALLCCSSIVLLSPS